MRGVLPCLLISDGNMVLGEAGIAKVFFKEDVVQLARYITLGSFMK